MMTSQPSQVIVLVGAGLHCLHGQQSFQFIAPNANRLPFQNTSHGIPVHTTSIRQRNYYRSYMSANLTNLRSLNRVSQVPNSQFCKNFISFLLNARSVCNKTLVTKDFVVDHAVDLLGITETWLHLKGGDITIGELCQSGYRFVHTPRLVGTGGGVGLLYKQGFCTKTRMCHYSFRSRECTHVTFINRKSICALVVYRPLGTGAVIGLFFKEFSSLLEKVVVCSVELLIIGDFDFHMDDTADRYAAQFGSILELFNLKQHVTVPTYRSGHILDLVIFRKDAEAMDLL